MGGILCRESRHMPVEAQLTRTMQVTCRSPASLSIRSINIDSCYWYPRIRRNYNLRSLRFSSKYHLYLIIHNHICMCFFPLEGRAPGANSGAGQGALLLD